MTQILESRHLAENIKAEAVAYFDSLRELGEVACLTTIMVGDNPASLKYIEMKNRQGADLGLDMRRVDLPASISQSELEATVSDINDGDTNSVLIQYPLPRDLNYRRAVCALDPKKDVDGLHPYNLGLLSYDTQGEGVVPCTPNGVIQLLDYGSVELEGANIVVVGRGLTIGSPLSSMLSSKNGYPSATVTTVYSGTQDMGRYTKDADIVVGAVGSPEIIDESIIGKGSVLVSVGVNYVDGVPIGDFTQTALDKSDTHVPVTGGIGPMTLANLWANVAKCHKMQSESR